MKGSLNIWLLVVVVICGLSYWFGQDLIRPGDHSPEPSASAAAELPISAAELVEPVHVLVLNGTDEGGLAREFGLLLGRAGCVAEKVGNAPHGNYERSFLVNRQLSSARAERLAAALGGLPILREFDGRSAADAVLVLGKDADRLREHLQQASGS